MIDSAKVLSGVPISLREPLLKSFEEIVRNFSEHRWEPAELNGGKFSEAVYSVISGAVSGTFPSKPSKPRDMVAACRALENFPPDPNRAGDRSLRILIPRTLQALYEIRNNRGVGHVGGDVDPNFLDATTVLGMASWVLAELVRIFHSVSTTEAQETVDGLVERKIPMIWEFENTRRVLSPEMNKGDQALLLLHAKPAWVTESDLFNWIEYSSASMFRTRILQPLHKKRLIEFDKANGKVRISPSGREIVETRILAPKK